ncbi:MAG: TolC family protein [Phycisphaerales bacterium]|nr:TolC family protein [Phycisphaerales bacterium]
MVAIFAGVAAGCGNPLGSEAYDRDRPPAMERLRQIDRLDRDRYARPASEQAPLPVASGESGAARVSPFARMERFELRLEDARAAVLQNNLDLRVALVDPTIQGEALRQEEAKFEAVFKPFVNFRNANNPTLNVTSANQQRSTAVGAEVEVPLRSGGRVGVNYALSRSETDNAFFAFPESYSSNVDFSLSQPLLRGAGRRANTYSIRIAGLDLSIAESRTKLEVIRQVAAADRAYWRLYAARQALEVRQKQYEVAQAQLDRARRRFAAGDAPELEVTRAQSGAASQLEQIILAEKAVLDQQREIKRLLNIAGLEMESKTLVMPTSAPDPVHYAFDGADLAAQGVANRMEMLELELRLAQDFSTIEFNKNQALPLMALDFSYRIPGLGGSFTDANDQLAGNDFHDWRVGLTGEIPIGNEAAKARVQQSIVRRLQRLSSKEARASAIRSEVLAAVDQIEASWQRILAAQQSSILAARTLEGEQRQFDAGARTSTDVLDAAARLADAQTSEVRALADYQIAQIDLAFATGTLVGAAKVDWTPLDPRLGQPAGGDPTPFNFPLYGDPAKARTPAQAEIERAAPPATATPAEPPPDTLSK